MNPPVRLLLRSTLVAWLCPLLTLALSMVAERSPADVHPPSFAQTTFGIRLTPAIDRIENEIPRQARKPESEVLPPGFELRLEGERDPFAITLRHDTMLVHTRYKYWLTARGRDIGDLSCGTPSDPRTASITAMVVIGWREDWELDALVSTFPVIHSLTCKPKKSAETKAREAAPAGYNTKDRVREEPEVRVLSVVNARIESTMVQPLAAALRTALREQAQLRTRASAVWEAFGPPFRIVKDGDWWLDYDPQRLLARPLVFAGDSLRVDLALEMLPVLYTARPEPSGRPLPENRVRLYDNAFEIAFDCGVWMDSLARRAEIVCRNRLPSLGVQAVTMKGSGDRVDVEVLTARRGTLHLTGRATFDQRSQQIRVDALADAAGAPRSALPASDRKALRLALEDAFREDVSEQIAGALEPLGHAMNRPVNADVRMSGGINKRRLLRVVAENGALVAHWSAGGRAWLHLR